MGLVTGLVTGLMMKHLLLVAHGSRREASNDEVRRLTAKLRDKVGARFKGTECAFLELAEPSIPDALQRCIDHGAEEIVVLPYFLSAGRHVARDIPAEVEAKQKEHPQVRISIKPYFGAADGITDLLAVMAD